MDPSWEAEQGEGQDFDRLIARDLKYFSGSHFSFIGRRCEAVEQKLATYKLDPIKNDENAPNLPLRTRKTHQIAIDNEEDAPNPPSRTRATHLISHHEEDAPNPSIPHEFLFQPQPASHIMSENSTLRGHPGITPIYHPSLPTRDRIAGGGSTHLDTQSWAATRRIKQLVTGRPHAPLAGTKDESDTSIGIFTDNMHLVRLAIQDAVL